MTTAHIPIGYEFENEEVKKIVQLADSAYALISGEVLFAHGVLEAVKRRIAETGVAGIEAIAELLRGQYQESRRGVVIRNELEPRGLDLNTYYNSQQRLIPQIVQVIDNAFRTYNPGVDLIVAGRSETMCSLYTIANPGLVVCNDPIGFAAVGSGAPHAMYSLIEAEYKKSLPKKAVREMVENAKLRSQVAPGVGERTETLSIPTGD